MLSWICKVSVFMARAAAGLSDLIIPRGQEQRLDASGEGRFDCYRTDAPVWHVRGFYYTLRAPAMF